METMHKVKAGLMRVLGIIIIALFVFMTLIGSYQIVTRYFFNRPSTVSEELRPTPLHGWRFWHQPMFSAKETT